MNGKQTGREQRGQGSSNQFQAFFDIHLANYLSHILLFKIANCFDIHQQFDSFVNT